jgi:hypothetical protein
MHRLLRAAFPAGALSLFAAAGAQAAYGPHTVIVKFKPGVASAAEQAVGRAAGVTALGYTIHGLGAQVAQVAHNPGATASAIRSKLDASVDDRGAAGRDPSFGFGRVNLARAATA